MSNGLNPAEREQSVLDFLNANGASSARAIALHLKLSRSPAIKYLRGLLKNGEVSVCEQRENNRVVPYYSAIVETIAQFIGTDRRKNDASVYTHRGTQGNHPIPNQGGQGAVFLPRRGIGPRGE